mgnify:CR=1 FL=1|tara:strand:+ start:989 stop:1672 length:684 start_codon:yes stop_codon:yes gene_type:complete
MLHLPDDCLFHILSYIQELYDFHSIASTCKTFSSGNYKNFIKNKFIKKKYFINYHFHNQIIWLVGGLRKMIFYPILDIDFDKLSNLSLDFVYEIRPKHMIYPIMIGNYKGKSFVSFLINNTINTINNYEVISIYQKYSYFESSWYSTNNTLLSNDTSYIIAGHSKGYFELLDPVFTNNIYLIIIGFPVHIEKKNKLSDISSVFNTISIHGCYPKSANTTKLTYSHTF